MSEWTVLPFWESAARTDAVAAWEDGIARLTYGHLASEVEQWRLRLREGVPARGLVLFRCTNGPAVLAPLIAALAEARPLLLADPGAPPHVLAALIAAYRPCALIETAHDGETFQLRRTEHDAFGVDPELALLLSTSGSTGSPRFVRLSRDAILANATAVRDALEIGPDDVAVAHLDVHYSYGWSVVSSHLAAGAAMSFTGRPFTDGGFWRTLRESGATHLPGVPVHYEIMHRLRPEKLGLDTVRTMTQAGGRLRAEARDAFHGFARATGKRFVTMYGQTEAAPRMSVLRHDEHSDRPASVGRALPGGSFAILAPDGAEVAAGTSGEVLYRGPNVMLGYANGWRDLARGDELGGALRTGDLGRVDAEGFLYLEGRMSRIGKVFGLRVNLDDVEAVLGDIGAYYACQGDDCVDIVRAIRPGGVAGGLPAPERASVLERLDARTQVPASAWRLHAVETIPVGGRGKIDYRALQESLDEPR